LLLLLLLLFLGGGVKGRGEEAELLEVGAREGGRVEEDAGVVAIEDEPA